MAKSLVWLFCVILCCPQFVSTKEQMSVPIRLIKANNRWKVETYTESLVAEKIPSNFFIKSLEAAVASLSDIQLRYCDVTEWENYLPMYLGAIVITRLSKGRSNPTFLTDLQKSLYHTLLCGHPSYSWIYFSAYSRLLNPKMKYCACEKASIVSVNGTSSSIRLSGQMNYRTNCGDHVVKSKKNQITMSTTVDDYGNGDLSVYLEFSELEEGASLKYKRITKDGKKKTVVVQGRHFVRIIIKGQTHNSVWNFGPEFQLLIGRLRRSLGIPLGSQHMWSAVSEQNGTSQLYLNLVSNGTVTPYVMPRPTFMYQPGHYGASQRVGTPVIMIIMIVSLFLVDFVS